MWLLGRITKLLFSKVLLERVVGAGLDHRVSQRLLQRDTWSDYLISKQSIDVV